MVKYFLGVDLGGTGVKLAITTQKGLVVAQSSFPNLNPSDYKNVVKEIVTHFNEIKSGYKVLAAGIGVAGDVDQKHALVRFSPNLKWKNMHLAKEFKKYLNIPVYIDNDANTAALGAYCLETKGKVNNLICVTLGTGIGGGFILDGKLFTGATGSAGEIGHITLYPGGHLCNCGNHGCVERYLGAPYISSEFSELARKNNNKTVSKLVEGDFSSVTPKIITLAANSGDQLAIDYWKSYGEKLGIVLAGLINTINPDMVVLAGGLSKAGNYILNSVKETVKKRAFKAPVKTCKIIISKYTQKLGVVGAALLATQQNK